MTIINKNRNSNSNSLTSNVKKSESNKEEHLKKISKDELAKKVRHGIERKEAILRKVKESPPIDKPGMTDNLADSKNGINKPSKLLPKPPPKPSPKSSPKPLPQLPLKTPTMSRPFSFSIQKNKPLPDTPIKKSKPLPATPLRKMQPAPIEIPKLDLGAIFSQMALFENAVKNNSDQINDLVGELNEVYKDGKVTNTTCERFARFGMLVGGNVTRLKAPIRDDIKLFASAWMKMINSNQVIKDEPWYEGVTAVSHEIVEHWN